MNLLTKPPQPAASFKSVNLKLFCSHADYGPLVLYRWYNFHEALLKASCCLLTVKDNYIFSVSLPTYRSHSLPLALGFLHHALEIFVQDLVVLLGL